MTIPLFAAGGEVTTGWPAVPCSGTSVFVSRSVGSAYDPALSACSSVSVGGSCLRPVKRPTHFW